MPSTATDLFSQFQRRLIRLDGTRARIEKLYTTRKINKFDIEQIYAGLYLDAFVSTERYIEELFIGYMSGKISPATRQVRPTLAFGNHKLARDVLMSGKRYLDWLPYKATRERASIYFREGHPFSILTRSQDNLLEELHRIRNALAHRSSHSHDIFLRLVIGELQLPPLEKRPAPFLRSTFRTNPHQTRLENYFVEILSLAQELSRG